MSASRTVISAVALAALLARGLYAQSAGEGPLVLRLPNSARFAAMANAGLASNDGDAMLYNPAMLLSARGLALSVQRYSASAMAGSFGTVTQAGGINVGIAAQFLEWQAPTGSAWRDAVRPGASHLADGGTVAASSSAFTLGMARTLFGYRLGANVKYAEDRFGASHDGTMAVDLGFVMPFGPGNLVVAAQNLGAGLGLGGSNGPLPRRVGVGLAGSQGYEKFDLGAEIQLMLEGNSFVRPSGGVELGYVPIEGVSIIARAGVRLPREKDESLITGGLGFTFDKYSIDYAFEPFRGGRPASHRIGLRLK